MEIYLHLQVNYVQRLLCVSGLIFWNLMTSLFIQYQTTWSKQTITAFKVYDKTFESDFVQQNVECL